MCQIFLFNYISSTVFYKEFTMETKFKSDFAAAKILVKLISFVFFSRATGNVFWPIAHPEKRIIIKSVGTILIMKQTY